MGTNEFQALFEGLLAEGIRENALKNHTVDPERLKVLQNVCERFSAIFGKRAELTLHPAFLSGDVEVEVPEVNLNQTEVSRLEEVLRDCDTFEIVPLVNGAVSLAATVERVFISSEN